jgi:hypothetical protein
MSLGRYSGGYRVLRVSIIVWFSIITLLGCSSKEAQIQAAIEHELAATEGRIIALKQGLDGRIISNATVLSRYADELSKQKPEYRELINAIGLDATPSGPLYKSLEARLNDAKNNPKLFSNDIERLNELKAIQEAATYSVFSDALSDPVNVLADMSDGKLARVNAISKEAENKSNANSPYQKASQLIGNPNYGQWAQGSDGLSFWEWYGMYAMLDNVLDFDYKRCKRRGWGYSGCNRYNYGYWSSKRPYSYYSDYGRSRYTSPKSYKAQNVVQNRAKKSFSKVSGKKFQSPYAQKKAGAAKLSQASKRTTSSVSRSSYSKSASSSSHRAGSSRRSRGVSRGK